MTTKRCTRSDCPDAGVDLPFDAFTADKSRPDGLAKWCRKCSRAHASRQYLKHKERRKGKDPAPVEQAPACAHDWPVPGEWKWSIPPVCPLCRAEMPEAQWVEFQAVAERLNSDFATLTPNDLDATNAEAARIKAQVYNRKMGEFANNLQGGELTEADGRFIGGLAEQERRWGNQRLARKVAVSAANRVKHLQLTRHVAETYFTETIQATGYAAKEPSVKRQERTLVLGLSDLHLGAQQDERNNPTPFRAVEEARAFESILLTSLHWKEQYRKETELLVLLNGDVIEGNLGHDRVHVGLAEQKAIFWHFFQTAFAHWADAFPKVHVVAVPGNHGRDLIRHPGRATNEKYDGHEWEMYYALQRMCGQLRNVTWDLGLRPYATVARYGANLLVAHGDTEPKIGDPDTKSSANAATMHKLNSTLDYGLVFDTAFFGHFHKARLQPKRPTTLIFNGAMVPPNGYARSEGYIDERPGQTLWEWVPGHPVGHYLFADVGSAYQDANLGKLVTPFRFPDAASL